MIVAETYKCKVKIRAQEKKNVRLNYKYYSEISMLTFAVFLRDASGELLLSIWEAKLLKLLCRRFKPDLFTEMRALTSTDFGLIGFFGVFGVFGEWGSHNFSVDFALLSLLSDADSPLLSVFSSAI